MPPIKPKNYVVVCKDNPEEFQEEIKSWIDKGYMFCGELVVNNGLLIREMMLVEQPAIKIPVPNKEKK